MEPASRPPSISWSFIPQNSPYVYATVGAFSELPWPGNDAVGYGKLGERVAELEVQGVDARKQLPEYEGKVLRGLELLGRNFRIDDADLERLGIGSNSRLTVYGVGLNVAARIEVAQPDVLRGHLESLLAELKLGGTRKNLNGAPYWEFEREDYTVFVALLRAELVAGIRWQGGAEPLLASLLGPAVNQVDPAVVFANISKRTEIGEYVGYVDFVALTRDFWQIASEEEPESKSPEQSAACRDEQDWMASAVPQLWFSGSVDAEKTHGLLFADLSPELVKKLRRMMRPVPAIQRNDKTPPLASFSVGLDMGLLMGYSRSLLDDLGLKEFACKELKSISSTASEWSAGVKSLAMTPLAGLTGVSGVLQSRKFDQAGNLEAKGVLAIAHASPASLLNVLRLVPEAKLPASLVAGSAPVPFYIKEFALLGPTMIALGDDAMGIAVGMSDELSATLAKPVTGEPELFHVYMGREFMQEDDEEDGGVDGVYDEAMAEAILAIGNGLLPEIDSTEFTVRAAELGIEMRFEARARTAN
jgi:hypothetical protein